MKEGCGVYRLKLYGIIYDHVTHQVLVGRNNVFPGGNPGGTSCLEDSLKKMIKEKTGLHVWVSSKPVAWPLNSDRPEMAFYFRCGYTGGKPKWGRWVSPKEIKPSNSRLTDYLRSL